MNGPEGSWAGQVRSTGKRGLGTVVGGLAQRAAAMCSCISGLPGYAAALQAERQKHRAGGQLDFPFPVRLVALASVTI